MKAVNANSRTGSEAIVIACIRWWVKEHDLQARIDARLKDLPSDAMIVMENGVVAPMNDRDLGKRFLQHDPTIPSECLFDVSISPGLDAILQIALEDRIIAHNAAEEDRRKFIAAGLKQQQEWAQGYVRRVLVQGIGVMVKQSPDWPRFKIEILDARKKLKVVTKVMTS